MFRDPVLLLDGLAVGHSRWLRCHDVATVEAMTATTGKGARRKGVAWEYEVRRAYERAGFAVRGLEGEGDHVCFRRPSSDEITVRLDPLVIHSEAKNQERLKVPEWWRQTVSEAPPSSVPVLTFKLPGGEMVSMLRTADLLRLAR